jgi:predicted RNase H-like HicB family nuclease
MKLEDCRIIFYRQDDGAWVAEVPDIPGCYALMDTRQAASDELAKVFEMLAAENLTSL